MIQKQTWNDEIRILLTDEENLGSVQVLIPLYVSDIFGKADALIYALFVDDVIILDKNFSKIGDIVKGTNKTAPHDTLYVKIVK